MYRDAMPVISEVLFVSCLYFSWCVAPSETCSQQKGYLFYTQYKKLKQYHQVSIPYTTVTHVIMMTFAYALEALTDELMEAVAPSQFLTRHLLT